MNGSFGFFVLRVALDSLVAVGGANSVAPLVRAQAVGSGLIDDRTFARLYAVSQFAPGPNILYVPLAGWTVAGIPGALVALYAFLVPSAILAICVDRFLRAHRDAPVLVPLRRVFRVLAGAFLTASGISLIVTFTRGAPLAVAVAVAAAAIVLGTRVNVLWCLAGAAVVGAFAR